jgi:hypothetical protein
MQAILSSVPTLAVSAIYCVWHLYGEQIQRRKRILRERVAYMLWTLANRAA